MDTERVAAAPEREPVGSLLFIGNATMLIRLGAITLLTDPNFLHQGQYAYLGKGLLSKRLTEPALAISELPPLDAIVLSHLHGDHWDRVAQRGLDRNLPVLTTPAAARRLQWRRFSRATGLRTWVSHTLVSGGEQVVVTALPGRHGPGPAQLLLPPVMGSMLEYGPVGGPVRLRMYISGDTLLIDDLRQIPARYPHIDAGVLHLGGTTLPGGLVVTMTGEQGAALLDLVRPVVAVPVHYDDYTVFRSPLADFRSAVEARGLQERIRYVARGDTLPLYAGSATSG